jgi:hypothetical protein
MTVVDWVVGAIGVAAVAAVIGIFAHSNFLIGVCGVIVVIGAFGLVWAWLASHKIFVFPPLIWTKVTPRPPKR